MRRLVLTLIVWLVVLGAGWLVGDRYGAPGWATKGAHKGFEFIENTIGGVKSSAREPLDSSVEFIRLSASADKDEIPFQAGDNAQLKTNSAGVSLIKGSNELLLEATTVNGRSYIGYGHMRRYDDPSKITAQEAELFLEKDIARIEDGVRNVLVRRASVSEFSAMVSLAASIGLSSFEKSPVLEKFNKGDKRGAADGFRLYNAVYGNVRQDLVNRREREREIFLAPA